MLTAYEREGDGLRRMPEGGGLDGALWIDLCAPTEAESAQVAALGRPVPTLPEMQEIEISARLYRAFGADYMTVVLPGLSEDERQVSGPVTFILSPEKLVTVRHHAPRPFETFPGRAEQSAAGCGSSETVFVGLLEEIVARLADLLEAVARTLDTLSLEVFGEASRHPDALRNSLEEIGREGERLSRVRLALLTVERALSFFEQTLPAAHEALRKVIGGVLRDIAALSVHADFLSSRITFANDTTLGLINLQQNTTVRIVSVAAVLFLPPTLVASIYGMNFRVMPELSAPWGYPAALVAMVASVVITYVYFKWRRWL